MGFFYKSEEKINLRAAKILCQKSKLNYCMKKKTFPTILRPFPEIYRQGINNGVLLQTK